jgi:CxxC motif-containing protein (DUF1111 family)
MLRRGTVGLASFFVFVFTGSPDWARAQFSHGGNATEGRVLFERTWKSQRTGGGPLGPMYNEQSCVACHSQGGVGGAGPNSRNVDLITVDIPDELRQTPEAFGTVQTRSDQAVRLAAFRNRLSHIHTGLAGGSIVLHAYGTDPRYGEFRRQVLGLAPPTPKITVLDTPPPAFTRPKGIGPIKTIEHEGGIRLIMSARNSTAMFGAGLINHVSEDAIRKSAEQQAEQHPEMKGRFLGRFGWRGQTMDIATFVAGACGVELGLGVPTAAAPKSPVAETLLRRQRNYPHNHEIPAAPTSTPELNQDQFTNLVEFVSTLPPPTRRKPVDDAEAELVRHGEAIFESTACGVCHRRSLGGVEGLYSDLLLHDLGPDLYDPQPPPLTARTTQYYGSGEGTPNFGEFVGNRPYEWRTPPLWGLADSGPYLHDGRAPTVEKAIELHGGQAATSVRKFRELSDADRRALLTFLSTLIAPEVAHLKRPLERAELPPGLQPGGRSAGEPRLALTQ